MTVSNTASCDKMKSELDLANNCTFVVGDVDHCRHRSLFHAVLRASTRLSAQSQNNVEDEDGVDLFVQKTLEYSN